MGREWRTTHPVVKGHWARVHPSVHWFLACVCDGLTTSIHFLLIVTDCKLRHALFKQLSLTGVMSSDSLSSSSVSCTHLLSTSVRPRAQNVSGQDRQCTVHLFFFKIILSKSHSSKFMNAIGGHPVIRDSK